MRPDELQPGDVITIVFHPSEQELCGTVKYVITETELKRWSVMMKLATYQGNYYNFLELKVGFDDDEIYTIYPGDRRERISLSDYLLKEGDESGDA